MRSLRPASPIAIRYSAVLLYPSLPSASRYTGYMSSGLSPVTKRSSVQPSCAPFFAISTTSSGVRKSGPSPGSYLNVQYPQRLRQICVRGTKTFLENVSVFPFPLSLILEADRRRKGTSSLPSFESEIASSRPSDSPFAALDSISPSAGGSTPAGPDTPAGMANTYSAGAIPEQQSDFLSSDAMFSPII